MLICQRSAAQLTLQQSFRVLYTDAVKLLKLLLMHRDITYIIKESLTVERYSTTNKVLSKKTIYLALQVKCTVML